MESGRMNKILAVVMVVAIIWGAAMTVLYFSPMGAETEATRWEEIQERGYLTVATSPDYPPFEFKEGDEIVGFDADIMRNISARLNLTLEWSEKSFTTIIPDIKYKNFDAAIAAFTIKASRLEGNPIQTTLGYLPGGVALVLTESATEACNGSISSLTEVEDYDFTIAVQSGTVQHERMLNLGLSDYIETYEKADSIVSALNSTSVPVDGAFMDAPFIEDIAEGSEKASWLGPAMTIVFRGSGRPYGILLHEDFDMLCKKMNAAITDMIADGTIDELRAKWDV